MTGCQEEETVKDRYQQQELGEFEIVNTGPTEVSLRLSCTVHFAQVMTLAMFKVSVGTAISATYCIQTCTAAFSIFHNKTHARTQAHKHTHTHACT